VKYLAIVATLAFVACEEAPPDTAEVLAAKAQCKDVLKHVVQISPRGQGKDPEQVVAALPIEDIQGCVATEPEVRDCMLKAPDIAGIKACIPSDDVLACMRTETNGKKEAHEKAKKKEPDPAIDKPFDDRRAKCWVDAMKGRPDKT
jgi:hypothetical protein